ncbi:MAG: hypothetical protein GC188_10005 [Alphaproteobacteria bacterium]|nr:hypothetical protein [Alphaproteobacteria bacterium]
MILARLSHAIRQQNWFAVVLEFVIVIAGVVIGFQITAWNERQAERELGRTYQALIVGEIERQRAAYERMIINAERIISEVEVVALAIDDPESVRSDPDRFVSAVWFSRYRSFTDANRTIYDGMESSGRIALIEDEAAVHEIRAFYRELANWEAIMVNGWNPWSRYNISLEAYFTRAEIAAIIDARVSGEPHGLFTPDEAVDLAVRLQADEEVGRLVRSIETRHYSVRILAREAIIETDATLAALGRPQETAE